MGGEEVINRFEFGVERGLARRQRERRDGLISVAMVRKTHNQADDSGGEASRSGYQAGRSEADDSVREAALTFRHSLVLFRALAMACPSFTKTQPTGTSSFASASSACKTRSVTADPTPPLSVARAHHDQRLSHPGEVDGGMYV
jgi:hypothetical protein